jgi:hypothetical protein
VSEFSPPDYPTRDETAARLRRRQRQGAAWLLTLIMAPLLLVVAVNVFKSSDRSPGTNTSNTMPTAIAPGAAYDGKQSKRLPVRVTPDTNIVDGQVVTVSGSGFPANADIAVIMCTNAAQTFGVDACDIMTSTGVSGVRNVTNSDGVLQVQYTVHRYITIAGQQVDCAKGNIDPAEYQQVLDTDGPFSSTTMPGGFSCIIAAAVLADHDQSGGWPIAFEGAQIGPGSPTPTTPVVTAAAPPPSYIEQPYGTPVTSYLIAPGYPTGPSQPETTTTTTTNR